MNNFKKQNIVLHIVKTYLNYILEILLLLVCVYYIQYITLNSTTFSIPWNDQFEKVSFLCILFVGLMKLVIRKRFDYKFIFSILVAAVYYLSYQATGYKFLLILAALTIACVDIYYKKMIIVQIIIVLSYLICAFLASQCGSISNLVYFRELGVIRDSFGICYPTDFASYLFFILLLAWIIFDKLPDTLFVLCGLFVAFISKYYAESSTSSICSCVFIVFVLLTRIEGRNPIRNRIVAKLKKAFNILLCIAFPFFAFLMLGLVFIYSKGFNWINKIDLLLSLRIELAHNAIVEHGLSLFGTPFDQIGAGGTTLWQNDYNFVDSTYPLILIRYGFVLFIVISVLWVGMTAKAVKYEKKHMVYGMALIALHAFSEHHFMEINYNILLILPFASHKMNEFDERFVSKITQKVSSVWKQKKTALIGACIISLAIILFCIKVFFPLLKTVVEIYEWNTYAHSGKYIFISYLLLLLTIIIGYCILVSVFFHIFTSKKKTAILQGISILIVLFIFLALTKIILENHLLKENAQIISTIESEKEILDKIAENGQGSLYIDTLPALYKHEIKHAKSAIVSASSLSRKKCCTILVKDQGYLECLTSQGYLYTKISDRNAIYTNDSLIIKLLQDKGYHLTGYYNHPYNVDLNWEAEINSLDLTEDNGLIVTGAEHSLIYGPYVQCYEGMYAVTYNLHVDEFVSDMDYQVCTLQVNGSWGKYVLASKEIYRSQFDENGDLTVELAFIAYDDPAIEFLIFGKEEHTVVVNEIQWNFAPSYDIHYTYSNNYKTCRIEYWDLFGERIVFPEGYSIIEQDYDKKGGNVLRQSYYDTNGEQVVINDGYAACEYQYDENRRIIREAYYGLDDQLVLCSDGYASYTQEYDASGNIIEIRYYGTDCQLITAKYGYAMKKCVYDGSNRVIKETYFDEYGNRTISVWGYSEIHYEYNENNQVVKEEYFGPDEKPIEIDTGYSVKYLEYDADGNVINEIYEGSVQENSNAA